MNIGIMASHFGSTLQAVIDAHANGELGAIPTIVLSNNSGSEALKRAERAGIASRHLSSKTHPDPAALQKAMIESLTEANVDLLVLAGYMKRLGDLVLDHFRGRVINTHPALLPKFGGQGMYGARVHRAVLDAGEQETGVTIHVVDSQYDTGPIVAQARVPVLPDDDSDSLAARVQAREKQLLVETLRELSAGRLSLPSQA